MVCLDNILFINVDCGPVPLCYFFGKQFFSMLYGLWKSSNSYGAVHIFGSSLHCAGKFMAKLYAAYNDTLLDSGKFSRKNTSLNCQLISNLFIQIHSFCRVTLLWSFSVLMGRKTDGQDLFLTKTIGFYFLLFNYMLLSVWIRIQTFNSLLINWIGHFIM